VITTQGHFSGQAAIAVGGFFCLLLAVVTLCVALMWRNQELQSEFDYKSRVLAGLGVERRLDMGANVVPAKLSTRLEAISAPTETVAASQLDEIISTALDEAGGSVISIQAQATTETIDNSLHRLTAEINFDSSIDALQKLLFHLETAIPYIFIDSIVVQPASASLNGAISGEVLLRVTLVASSYWNDVAVEGGH
jgi:general secretion pathway protein M